MLKTLLLCICAIRLNYIISTEDMPSIMQVPNTTRTDNVAIRSMTKSNNT